MSRIAWMLTLVTCYAVALVWLPGGQQGGWLPGSSPEALQDAAQFVQQMVVTDDTDHD